MRKPETLHQLCGPTRRDPHLLPFEADSTYSLSYHMQKVHSFVVCPSTKGYTDQQLIAGRAIQASFSWLNREREEVGNYKERRLSSSGPTMTASITPMVFATTELNLKGKAEFLPLVYMGHQVTLLVRPEHPTTAHAMTYTGEVANRLPLCSDLLHNWALGLVTGAPMALTKMDPLSSPDLLFPMPDRSPPLCHITPNDVKLLTRPNEKGEQADKLISAWETLINLFFAMAQIMRLCADYEQINKSPFASYHQHALVSPDTLSLSIPDKVQDKEDEYNPPKSIHGLFASHFEAKATAEQWGQEIHACSVNKLARQQKMTYHCEYSTASTDARLSRLRTLDKVTCGLASVVRLTTPTMDLITDSGVELQDLGPGILHNQQVVMPYFAAYQQVRKSVVDRSSMGPVETLRHGLPKDPSDWDEVKFVSEKQVIEQMAGKSLTKGIGTKLMANFARLMRATLGTKNPEPKTPDNKPSMVKKEMTSPGAPAQEFDGEYQGYVSEGKFVSISSYVRSFVHAFAERIKSLWQNVASDPVNQPFIPRKSPKIFRWFSNDAWNPRDWITKRLSVRQKVGYWDDEELMAKVRSFADPRIQIRKWQNQKAKDLQDELSALFDEKVRSIKDSHILIWMICIYMHSELEKNSTWSLPPLYTQNRMSSIFNFIYHLTNDLGNVAVMKALSGRGHSLGLYKCEEGTYHYPGLSPTLWADVGNAMYGYLNKHLELITDAPGINQVNAGDVIEIAYNLYAMYAVLNVDVSALLNIDQSVLYGWWAQVNLIQRDAYIQSASMLSGKGCSTARFEQVCIYVSGLTQLTATEAISNVRGKESHTGLCPVPYCYVCGATVGKQGETESLSLCGCSVILVSHR